MTIPHECQWQVSWVLGPSLPLTVPSSYQEPGPLWVTRSIISVPLFTHTAPSTSFFWFIRGNALTTLPRQRPSPPFVLYAPLKLVPCTFITCSNMKVVSLSGSSWCRQRWFSMCQSLVWLKVVALFLPVLGCLLCNILIWSFEVFTILKHSLMLALFGDRRYLSEKYFLSLNTENYRAFLKNN